MLKALTQDLLTNQQFQNLNKFLNPKFQLMPSVFYVRNIWIAN